MESLGDAAQRLLANLEARIARKKASERLQGSDKFSDRQPQARPGGNEDGPSCLSVSRPSGAHVAACNDNRRHTDTRACSAISATSIAFWQV